MPTALITGGSSGLGASFADALAANRVDLVLVARNKDRLAATADQLRQKHRVSVEIIAADLAERKDVARVAERVEDELRPVDVLINNAGFGVHSPLTDPDTALHEKSIDVMIRAVLILGGSAARAMRARGSGTIINVSSVAGYVRMGSYSAVKSWVTSYSEGLAVEMRGTGVQVTAVTPGWVRTEFHDRAGINTRTVPGPLWTTTDVVTRSVLRDVRHGKVISTPTLRFRVLVWFCRHLPQTTIRLVSGKISHSRQTPTTAPPTRGRR